MLEALRDRATHPDHLAEYEKQLALPPFPKPLAYLWRIFWRIRKRKGGGFGPAPIEWPDIDAFTRHTQVRLRPFELEVIEDLDDLYMAEQAKQQRNMLDKH